MDSIIELRHLKTLLALEETGSVSLAAKRVFLTQSALSHQIRMLETTTARRCSNANPRPCALPRWAKGCCASPTN
ncbi:transcriptional activator MetR [Neisseria gonorrhoeae]|uniref:Transcriptional activator MetR n=1 Tax=Neisseria gonorrhoeae TaxID=485 RepID=A0A378W138_NEIGO|nr:transcriptional activator MetR [Neisseria gonorrhoeae]